MLPPSAPAGAVAASIRPCSCGVCAYGCGAVGALGSHFTACSLERALMPSSVCKGTGAQYDFQRIAFKVLRNSDMLKFT